jgi:hypothetical protein
VFFAILSDLWQYQYMILYQNIDIMGGNISPKSPREASRDSEITTTEALEKSRKGQEALYGEIFLAKLPSGEGI